MNRYLRIMSKVSKIFRLQGKLTLVILINVGTTIAGMSYFASQSYYKKRNEYVSELTLQMAGSSAKLIDLDFSALDQKLRVFGEILRSHLHKSVLRQISQAAVVQMPEVELLHVYGRKGLIYGSVEDSKFLAETDKISNPNLKIIAGELYFFTDHEEFRYVARLKKNLFSIFLTQSDSISLFLVNEKGQVISSNKGAESQFADQIPKELWDQKAEPREQIWSTELSFSNSEKGFGVVAQLAKLPGLSVVSIVKFSDIYPMLFNIVKSSSGFVIILFIFAVLIGIMFSNRIIKPIHELTQAVSEVASGNWIVKVKTRSRDEIGSLVQAFTKMGQQLAKRESELQETQRDLMRVERLAVLGKFGAGIAHEVKNPLNSILGYAQLLQRKNTIVADSGSLEYVQYILDETRRATRIINDLLTFARQKQPSRTKVRVQEIIDYAMGSLMPLAKQAKVAVLYQTTDENLEVNVDRDQIVQVIINLVTNAIHSLEEKTGLDQRKVSLSVSVNGQQIVLEIKDNGSGISKENLGRIFEPFFTTKRNNKGTGLGLALCYGIVQAHQGKVSVFSELGVGTVFTVELPKSSF